jgi:two-component system response regulator RegA
MTDAEQCSERSILLVDDDEPFRQVLALAFRKRGYDVRVAGDYDEAVTSVLASPPQFALVDLRLPGRSGLELIEAIRRIHQTTIVVVLSGERGPSFAAHAKLRGAARYLTKPLDVDEIIVALDDEEARSEPCP